jgi:molybdopterin/thiamine biosynthesis adenylyltransferase
MRRLRRSPDVELTGERRRRAYYPWRRVVVSVLGPRAFRVARLDRNRNLITSEEQDQLGALRIGVVGLSVGHAVAYTLAAQGLCGELRLADFDDIDLSNLNRVPASVLDLGVNKATVAARRIAELDPYQPVRVLTSGLTPHNIDDFLDGLDIVVEECDSLDMKILLREAARARGLPVLMATSDRGLVDVERYDLEARRPILHGLLGDVDVGAGQSRRGGCHRANGGHYSPVVLVAAPLQVHDVITTGACSHDRGEKLITVHLAPRQDGSRREVDPDQIDS